MKTLLSFVVGISVIGGSTNTVLSCKPKENENKAKLGILINRVELIIEDESKNEKDSNELDDLIDGLKKAKKVYSKSTATNYDYKLAQINLNSDLKEFEEPGYKLVRNQLTELIIQVRIQIKNKNSIYYSYENNRIEEDLKIFENLRQALKDAEKIVEDEEADTISLSFSLQILKTCFFEYQNH